MKIVTLPQPILRLKSLPVAKIDGDIKKLVKGMIQALDSQADPEGVGLAAVQIGVLKRIFIAKIGGKNVTFINPQVKPISETPSEIVEGCLSVPQYYGIIKRPAEVEVKAQNLQGRWFRRHLRGLTAHIILHEIDHLEGILFLDHLASQKQKLFRRIGKDKKGQDKFAEVKVPWTK